MEAREHRGRPRARIGWVIAALALIPLLGLAWFVTNQTRDALAQRQQTAAVIEATDRSIALVQLASAVADEKYWTHAENSLADLGVDPSTMTAIVGIDVPAELDLARDRVDHWLGQLRSSPFDATIDELRSDSTSSTGQLTARFEPFEAEIEGAHDRAIERAIELAADLPDGARLVQATRALEAAASIRSDSAWQLGAFFGARFAVGRSPLEENQLLIERTTSYTLQMDALALVVTPGSRIATALERTLTDDDVLAFQRRLRDQLDDALEGRLIDPADDISGAVDDPGEIATTFTSALNATRSHLDLVTAAGEDVTAEARVLGVAADRALVLATATGLVIVLLSLIGVLASTQIVVDPLQRLANAAAMLRSGRLDVEVEERGPHELQTAARAMNEAIDQLQLVERQALALADGTVDDPILDTEAPGRLGESLQRAVAQLRGSLTEREDFRRRLAHEAAHDGLTGLPNRRAASAHLNQALARAARSRETAPCCSSTSTSSRRSTISTGTVWAIGCSRAWRTASSTRCATATWPAGSEGTSSSWSPSPSATATMPSQWRRASWMPFASRSPSMA